MKIENYNHYTFYKEGWVCPICKQVNAPWKPSCSCNGKIPTISYTGTSKEALEISSTSNKTESED